MQRARCWRPDMHGHRSPSIGCQGEASQPGGDATHPGGVRGEEQHRPAPLLHPVPAEFARLASCTIGITAMADRIKVWLERQPAGSTSDDGAAGAGGAGRASRPASAAGKAAGADGASSSSSDSAAGDGAARDAGKLAQSGKPNSKSRTSAAATPTPAIPAQQVAAIKLTPQDKTQAAKAQAAALRDAASRGVPFCEECERARRELAAQWRGAAS